MYHAGTGHSRELDIDNKRRSEPLLSRLMRTIFNYDTIATPPCSPAANVNYASRALLCAARILGRNTLIAGPSALSRITN